MPKPEPKLYDLTLLTLEEVKSFSVNKQLSILWSWSRYFRYYNGHIKSDCIQNIVKHMLITISNKGIYAKRLGIIMSQMLNNVYNQEKLIWIDILVEVKPKLDLTIYNASIAPPHPRSLVNQLFYCIKSRKTGLTGKEKVKYYKKLFSWISHITDINTLNVIDQQNAAKAHFFSYWLDRNGRDADEEDINHIQNHLLYVIFESHGQYGINLMKNIDFLTSFFWPESIQIHKQNYFLKALRKEIINTFPVSFFYQTYLHGYEDHQKIINLIMYYSLPEVIDDLIENRKDIITNEVSAYSILCNPFFTLQYKKNLIQTLPNVNKELKGKQLIIALKSSKLTNEEDVLDLFNFCKNALTITEAVHLYHELAQLDYFRRFNLEAVEDYIFSLNGNINEKNKKEHYPIHYLAATSKLANHIFSGCHDPDTGLLVLIIKLLN